MTGQADRWIRRTTTGSVTMLALIAGTVAAAHQSAPSPEAEALREEIQTCVRQLSRYRATLDSGGDPAVVGQWITETQARKLAAETRLRGLANAQPPGA